MGRNLYMMLRFFACLGLLAFEMMYSMLVLGFCSWGLKLWILDENLLCVLWEKRGLF